MALKWEDIFTDFPDQLEQENNNKKKKLLTWEEIMAPQQPVLQPVSEPLAKPVSKAQIMLQPYLEKGMDAGMALEAAKEARSNRVNFVINKTIDDTNPIDILSMDIDKFHRKSKDFKANEDEITEAYTELQKDIPDALAQDWFERIYGIKDRSIEVAFDAQDEIAELMTKDVSEYTGKFLTDTDRKRAAINAQLKIERDKSVEEYDQNKIDSLWHELTSLGKAYIDMDGKVIDIETATPEQKEYINAVDKYFAQFEEIGKTDEDKLKDAFFKQYGFVRFLDELYDMDVVPWIETQIKAQTLPHAGPSPVSIVLFMPKNLKQIVEQRREATAQLAALTKLYIANTSPANVKKNLKYFLQSTIKGLATGLIGQGAVSAIQDQLGPTERDMLDAAQEIMNARGLPISKDVQDNFDRSIFEYAVEGGSQILGTLPLLGAVGAITKSVTTAIGLEHVLASWAGGERAIAAGLTKVAGYVDKSNAITKTGALMVDMGIEELKLAGVLGFGWGTGSGFVIAGRLTPVLKLTNPIAKAFNQVILKPNIITASMYTARATQALAESMISYQPFSDLLAQQFGDRKELIGTALANFIWAFGGGKSVPKEKYENFNTILKEKLAIGDKTFTTKKALFEYLDEVAIDKETGLFKNQWMPQEAIENLPDFNTLKAITQWEDIVKKRTRKEEPISNSNYVELVKDLKKEGQINEALWLEQQIKGWTKMDKAAAKAYRKGKYEGLSEKQIFEKMKTAEEEAKLKAEAAAQITMEERGLLERTVPSERLSIVMKESKMVDKEGNPEVWFHGTDRIFNRFEQVVISPVTGRKANARSLAGLTIFAETSEAAKTFGENVEGRYLNFKNPVNVGNIRSLTAKKIKELRKTHDGIIGWARIEGKKVKVAAAFGTQGIIKAEELLPFKSKHAETMRSWAEQIRSKEINFEGMHLTSVLPIDLKKAGKMALNIMADALEVGANMVEAIEKGFAYLQEKSWYKKWSPELRAKYDPIIRAELQRIFEETRPEAVAKYDIGRATKMVEEVTTKYLPEFKTKGETLAKDFEGRFITSVKKPEDIVAKKQRQKLTDVLEIPDVLRGAIIVKNFRNFKAMAKQLKKDGYTIHIIQVPKKESGYRGIYATKQIGELGAEIQIHTEKTWEAQQKAEEFRYKYQKEGIPPLVEPAKIDRTKYIPEEQIKVHKEFGGSTFTLEGKNLAGAKGKASVSIFPDRTEKVNEITSEILNNFIKKNEDILKGNENILSIGTWKNETGNIELDIVATPSLNKAIELGKKYNQKAIFDLENMKDVPTGGSGSGEEFVKISIEDRLKEIREEIPRSQYEIAMEESRKLYAEAYEDLENIELEGSPFITPYERKMKQLQIPISVQKELKKAWTETKQKIVEELKDKNVEIKQAFKDFVKNLPGLTGLNIKLKKSVLNMVNSIDFTKPASLKKAIAYIDKIVTDATFRLEVIESEKALEKFDYFTSDEYIIKRDKAGFMKNKLGPSGLLLRDELKNIRKDMIEGDWQKGHDTIDSLLETCIKENRELTDEEFNHITLLNFKGLLNATNGADLNQMQGALRDLKEIIKLGKTKAAAERMVKRAQQTELNDVFFKILDGKPGKPVQLDQRIATNIRITAMEKAARYLNWMQLDTWFTLLDKFSIHDKTSKPGFSDLNKVLGGAVIEADRNDYRRKTKKYNEVQTKFKDIFGLKSNTEMYKLAKEHTRKLYPIEYIDPVSGEKKTFGKGITINQAYKVWQELQNPKLDEVNETNGYIRNGELTSFGQAIIDVLTPEVTEWAKWQLEEFYPAYYPEINEVYRKYFGTDLPMEKMYSPIFVAEKSIMEGEEDIEGMLAEKFVHNSTTNGSLKARIKHNKGLAWMDGDKVLMNYIDKMEFFINWSDAVTLLNDVFIRDNKIRSALRQNFGPVSLQVVKNFIDEFSRAPKKLTEMTKIIDTIRKNFTVASLAIKPTVFFNQLTAIPAYMEYAPGPVEWTKNTYKMLTDWKGNKKYLNDIIEDPFWKERYQEGWDWTVIDAMEQDLNSLHTRGLLKTWKGKSMFLTKYGDMGSLIIGGLPLYRYVYEKTLKETGNEREAKAQAMATFTEATRNSQQAGQKYDLSVMQRANSFTKLLTMYKTAPFSYHRKVAGAIRNWSHGRGTWQDNARTILIYHVLLPQLFQFAGNAFQWDGDDVLQALILGNFNEIFVLGDVIRGITNTVRGLPYQYQASPIESTARTAQQATQHIKSYLKKKRLTDLQMSQLSDEEIFKMIMTEEKNVEFEDLLKAIEDGAKIAGDLTGLPVRGAYSIGKGIYEVTAGKKKEETAWYKIARILGWSDQALQRSAVTSFDDEGTEEQMRKLMENTKEPTFEEIFKLQEKYEKRKKK